MSDQVNKEQTKAATQEEITELTDDQLGEVAGGGLHCGVDLRRAEPQETIWDPRKHGVKR